MRRERSSSLKLIARLEAEALRVRKEADRIRERRKKNLVYNRYLKLMSRIEAVKNTTSITLTRYE